MDRYCGIIQVTTALYKGGYNNVFKPITCVTYGGDPSITNKRIKGRVS